MHTNRHLDYRQFDQLLGAKTSRRM